MKIEEYINSKDEIWVRVKFFDKYKTEVIMSKEEFENKYGKVDKYKI